MTVVGTINPMVSSSAFDPSHILAYAKSSKAFPTIFCPQSCNISVQVIIFDRPCPHRMQYMSLEPMSLVLSDKSLGTGAGPYLFDGNDHADELDRARKERLIEKLKLHTAIRHTPSQKEKLLPSVLAQINCSSELADLMTRNAYLLKARPKRSLSVSEKVVESATTIRNYVIARAWHAVTVWIYPLLIKGFVSGLLCHRFVAEVVLRILEWRLRPDSAALKDVSATAQQVDIRLQQFCYWPIQYLTLRKRKDDWESVNDRHPDYIRFYNSLWLVANDVIIGIAVGSYIIDNAAWVAWQINASLNGWTIDGLRDTISWLTDWPAGLKLNTELALFLGDLFLWVIDCWKGSWTTEICG